MDLKSLVQSPAAPLPHSEPGTPHVEGVEVGSPIGEVPVGGDEIGQGRAAPLSEEVGHANPVGGDDGRAALASVELEKVTLKVGEEQGQVALTGVDATSNA